jgi:hypothetical protein
VNCRAHIRHLDFTLPQESPVLRLYSVHVLLDVLCGGGQIFSKAGSWLFQPLAHYTKISKLGCLTMAVDYTNLFLFDILGIKTF